MLGGAGGATGGVGVRVWNFRRVGVVTIDVPERERGIDFEHENATVA